MDTPAPRPVAKFSIELLVMSDSSVGVQVKRAMLTTDPSAKLVDEALGPAMEALSDRLADEVRVLHEEGLVRPILQRAY